MKKRMSAAALALRLTALPGFLVTVLTAAVQIGLFLSTRYAWSSEDGWDLWSFEQIVESEGVALAGLLGFVVMFVVLVLPCCSLRNRNVFTLRRLKVSEKELTAIWAAVFSGYFLMAWAVQLGLMIGLYAVYAREAGSDAMGLFLAAYRSSYFHTLLPLAEVWGYVRNVALCLGWGTLASLMARHMRHEGKPYMLAVLVILTGWLLPKEMASADSDILLIILTAVVLACQIAAIQGGEENED